MNNDDRCENLFTTLEIEQCNYQESCNQTVYDLSTCITASIEITTTVLHTTTDQFTDYQYNRDGDAVTNSIATTEQSVTEAFTPTIVYRTDCQCYRDRDVDTNSTTTTEQSQAYTPTTLYRTKTIDRTEVANSSTNQQSIAIVALAIIVAILIVLLVIISVALIRTCWILKTKGARKSQNQYR